MTLSDVLRHFEGLQLTSYPDANGVWTVGWGATGPDVVRGVTWTRAQADVRLFINAQQAQRIALNLCPQLNSNNKLLAVADFTYNLGATRLAGSTLRRKIRVLDWAGAAAQFPRWTRCGAQILPGLVARRAFEQSLFLRS